MTRSNLRTGIQASAKVGELVIVVAQVSAVDYRSLLAFRTQLRRFDHWSKERAADFGLTHAQHQLLLAIRGHDDSRGPTIGEVADYLLIRHHTAVELIDRAQDLGFVIRRRDKDDGRIVRLALTAKGRGRIKSLAAVHLAELRELAPVLTELVERRARVPQTRHQDSRTRGSSTA